MTDDSGNLRGYVKVARDNTWGKQAQDALKESEAEFRAIFELAGTGKIETKLRTGRFIRVNQKFCDILGYSKEELLTMTYIELSHPNE
jgi:PAS domain-containing protein